MIKINNYVPGAFILSAFLGVLVGLPYVTIVKQKAHHDGAHSAQVDALAPLDGASLQAGQAIANQINRSCLPRGSGIGGLSITERNLAMVHEAGREQWLSCYDEALDALQAGADTSILEALRQAKPGAGA